MWINRKKYEEIKRTSEENQHDADMFRRLKELDGDRVICHNNFVIFTRKVYDTLLNKFVLEEDKVKNLEAELEWYKVKYHELRNKKENI